MSLSLLPLRSQHDLNVQLSNDCHTVASILCQYHRPNSLAVGVAGNLFNNTFEDKWQSMKLSAKLNCPDCHLIASMLCQHHRLTSLAVGAAGNLFLFDDTFEDNVATNGAAVYSEQGCGEV